MPEHTPGPWNWWTSNGLMRLTAGAIGGRDGGVLCAVRRSDGFADIEVSEADARLIAAAPTMLAALQSARVSLFSCMDALEGGDDSDEDTLQEIDKAIAEATEAGNG